MQTAAFHTCLSSERSVNVFIFNSGSTRTAVRSNVQLMNTKSKFTEILRDKIQVDYRLTRRSICFHAAISACLPLTILHGKLGFG